MKKTLLFLLLIVVPVISQQLTGREPLLGEQINWAHPNALQLRFCFIINEGSGSRVNNLADLNAFGNVKSDAAGDWEPGLNGWAIKFEDGGSNDKITVDSEFVFPRMDGWLDFSLFARIKHDNGAESEINDIAAWWSFTGPNRRAWLITHHSSDLYFFEIDQMSSISGGTVDDQWHDLFFTYSNASGFMRIYLDGIEVASDGTGNSGAINNLDDMSTIPLTIAHQADAGSGNGFEGLIDVVMIWNREYHAKEISNFNPYDMFEQPLWGRIFAADAAAAARRVIQIN